MSTIGVFLARACSVLSIVSSVAALAASVLHAVQGSATYSSTGPLPRLEFALFAGVLCLLLPQVFSALFLQFQEVRAWRLLGWTAMASLPIGAVGAFMIDLRVLLMDA